MKTLSVLQLHMLRLLIHEPLTAFKYRHKYMRSFDSMFNIVFGKSFGVELELNPNMYKQQHKNQYFFKEDDRYMNKINAIERNFKANRTKSGYGTYNGVATGVRRDVNGAIQHYHGSTVSKYRATKYVDSVCHEYTFPVRAMNLHVIYKYMKKIQSVLIGPLGTTYDQSSSMHIHNYLNQVSIKYLDKAFDVHIKKVRQQTTPTSLKASVHASRCLRENSAYVIPLKQYANYNANGVAGERCHECLGCNISNSFIGGSNDVFIKKTMESDLSRSRRLLSTNHRYYYLIQHGLKNADFVYNQTLRLVDTNVVPMLSSIFGIWDNKQLDKMLDNFISYFIPYTQVYKSNIIIKRGIRYNSEFESIETRLFTGTTDFKIILQRGQLIHAMLNLMHTHDPYLLNLFIDTLV